MMYDGALGIKYGSITNKCT